MGHYFSTGFLQLGHNSLFKLVNSLWGVRGGVGGMICPVLVVCLQLSLASTTRCQ